MRPRKFRGGIGHMPNPHGHNAHVAAQDYFDQCGIHTHPHSECDTHHHIPPDCDYPPEDPTWGSVYDQPAGSGIGGCSTGSCGVGALPDGTIVKKPRGMTRAGHRKFMKRLGKGRAQTSLTARRVARGMGVVGTYRG